MSPEQEIWWTLQGRMFALEAMVSHVIWRHCLSQQHPPTAMAELFRPIEEQIAAMKQNPDMPEPMREAAAETVRTIGEMLFEALAKESLLRASPEGSGQA